jgi:hypothetical protein
MQNNLPESIKKRIEDEAEKPYRQREQEMKEHHRSVFKLEYVEGYTDGYENAAEAILSKPGEYGLAGAWSKASDMAAKTHDFVTVYARYKDEIVSSGYFVRNGELFMCHCENYPIESSQFNDLYIWDESATPSDRVGQLEQALKLIQQMTEGKSATQAIHQVAANALNQ